MKQFSPKLQRLVLVDGWMNRWMDSWTNGLIGGGMNKWTDEWTAPPHVQTTALQLESLCALVRPKSWFTSVYWRSNGWPSLICRLTEPLTTQSSVICVRTINTSGQDGRPPWPTPWPSTRILVNMFNRSRTHGVHSCLSHLVHCQIQILKYFVDTLTQISESYQVIHSFILSFLYLVAISWHCCLGGGTVGGGGSKSRIRLSDRLGLRHDATLWRVKKKSRWD